jgi:hypothetical protein
MNALLLQHKIKITAHVDEVKDKVVFLTEHHAMKAYWGVGV